MPDTYAGNPYKIITTREHSPYAHANKFAQYAYYKDSKVLFFDSVMDKFEANMADLVEMPTAKDAIAYAKTHHADFVCFEDLGEVIWRKGDAHNDWTPKGFTVIYNENKEKRFNRLLDAYDFVMQHPNTVIMHEVKISPNESKPAIIHIVHDRYHNSYMQNGEFHIQTKLYSFVSTPNAS